jgi:uncharacterized protein (DUF2252 family)
VTTALHAPTPQWRASPAERAERGLAARAALPRDRQAELVLPAGRRDLVSVMEERARTMVPELVPVRYGRMMTSPFAFLRGSAAVMAADLGAAPVSGIAAQVCGDAHLSNFGLFRTDERRLLFDLTDFDESVPGPWEWDLKRLAASIVVAGRGNDFSHRERRENVVKTVRRYRDATARFAAMRTLDVWYARADADEVRDVLRPMLGTNPRRRGSAMAKVRANRSLKGLEHLAEVVDGRLGIRADPPLVVPLQELLCRPDRDDQESQVGQVLARYRRRLTGERRMLLNQFEVVDVARKLVGVGGVGTRCWIVLLRGRDAGEPLFLQVKEAQPSVLAPYAAVAIRRPIALQNDAERVVAGQRLMQAGADMFLGWQRIAGDGRMRDYYVRQLRDTEASADVERMDPHGMTAYGRLCGWTLARAHARSGDPVAVSRYLGDDDVFPEAVAAYAEQYADQTERDHANLLAAVETGRLRATLGV